MGIGKPRLLPRRRRIGTRNHTAGMCSPGFMGDDTPRISSRGHGHLINQERWEECHAAHKDSTFSLSEEFRDNIQHLVNKIFGERHTIHAQIKNVVSWNSEGLGTGSMKFEENFSKGKIRKIINRVHKKGVLLWQETHMN